MSEKLQWPSLADRRRTARLAIAVQDNTQSRTCWHDQGTAQLLPPRRRRVHNNNMWFHPVELYIIKFFPAKNHQTVERTTPGGGRGQHHWHICVTPRPRSSCWTPTLFWIFYLYIFIFSFVGFSATYINTSDILLPQPHTETDIGLCGAALVRKIPVQWQWSSTSGFCN